MLQTNPSPNDADTALTSIVWQQVLQDLLPSAHKSASPADFMAQAIDAYTRRLAEIQLAEWSTAYVNDLPDSAFLYIAPGGSKDEDGRTTPRSLRYFPVRDASGKLDLPHLRNAIARAPQANVSAEVKDRVQARARRLLEEASEKNGAKSNARIEDHFAEMIAFGVKSLDRKSGDWLWIGSSHNAWQDSSDDIIPLKLIIEDIEHQTRMIEEGKMAQYGYGLWEDHSPQRVLGTCEMRAVLDGGRSCLEMGTLRDEHAGLKPAPMSIGYRAMVGDDGEYKAIAVYERSRLAKTVPVNRRTFWRARKRMSDKAIAAAARALAEGVAR